MNYRVSVVMIFKKIDCVIMAPRYTSFPYSLPGHQFWRPSSLHVPG